MGSEGELRRVIELVCVAKAHAIPKESGTVRVVEGRWAFCPAGSPDGHEWQAIAKTALFEIAPRNDHHPKKAGGG